MKSNNLIKYRQPLFENGQFKEFHYWGIGLTEGSESANVGWMTFKLGVTDPKQSQIYINRNDVVGNEIYVGDLVKDISFDNRGGATYEIRHNDVGFIGVSNDGDDWGPYTLNLFINDQNPKLSVVGNIYETKK